MQQHVRSERQGHILVITMDRPDKLNAFNDEMSQALEQAADLLDEEDDLFIGVLTGAGGVFSAGADLKAAAKGERIRTPKRGIFGFFGRPPRKPILAAVEGYAVGGGFELCLSCDLIVASTSAKFGLPEVRHNVLALGGGLFRLPQRMPYHAAMEMVLTGESRDAHHLHRMGVVNRVVDEGTALPEALKLAHRILENGPTAIAASKEIVFHSGDWTEEMAWKEQNTYARAALRSDDSREGLRAFAEKRRPVWKGR